MTDMTVSKTILSQLGSHRFVAMTGAKDFVGSDNALSFRIGSNAKRVTHVRVVLDASDTYTLVFSRRIPKAGTMLELSRAENIYCNQLNQVFERHTGLATRL